MSLQYIIRASRFAKALCEGINVNRLATYLRLLILTTSCTAMATNCPCGCNARHATEGSGVCCAAACKASALPARLAACLCFRPIDAICPRRWWTQRQACRLEPFDILIATACIACIHMHSLSSICGVLTTKCVRRHRVHSAPDRKFASKAVRADRGDCRSSSEVSAISQALSLLHVAFRCYLVIMSCLYM